MGPILLPGLNLKGRLPSVSGLTSAGATIAFSGTHGVFSGFTPNVGIPYRAGTLLRVPKVVWLVNNIFSPPGDTEYTRIADELDVAADRIAASIPDAIVAIFNLNGSGSLIPLYFDDLYMPTLRYWFRDAPVLGSDLLAIGVGIITNVGPIGGALDASGTMPGYSVRLFLQERPNLKSLRTFDQAVADVESYAASGIDVAVMGGNAVACSGPIAAIVSDHYGVEI